MSRYAAVVLAAGQGTRFVAAGGGGPSKLLASFGGRPLVRHVAELALACRAFPVIVVVGHAAEAVEAALEDLPLRFAVNPAYASGLASSLRAGLSAVPCSSLGAVVLLADMPAVACETLDALIVRAEACPEADAIVPTFAGQRGNPVLLRRSLFAAAQRLTGDAGARYLLRDPALKIAEVACRDQGIAWDVDRPEQLGGSAAQDGGA